MTYAKVSGVHIEQQLADIDQALNQFEIEHQAGEDRLALVLTQQLRLIVQLLPQLQALVNKEHFYSQQH
ncbi:integral membrane protein [Actinobacillus equuli]|nr:integral membrane protein [Actinobacillus equuli]